MTASPEFTFSRDVQITHPTLPADPGSDGSDAPAAACSSSDGIPESLSVESSAATLPDVPTAARQLVDALVAAGVDTFFGIPGGPVSPVFDAIVSADGATLVESRHESSAAFAAAGYYRASGKVPAVVVTAGPGITNAVTGVVSAHLERIPMLVICGDVPWATSGGVLSQDSGPSCVGAESMLAHVTRATVRVSSTRSAVAQTMSAVRAATNPDRPGPALVVLPIDRARGRVVSGKVRLPSPPPVETAPDPVAVAHTCELLAGASRPLVVIGSGCRAHAADIRRLVDALDVPFVTTPKGKGIVSELHPRSLRHGGVAASMWARRYTEAGVDVALILGTDLDDSSIGLTPYVGPGGRLIHVDLDPGVFDRSLPAYLGVAEDVGAFCRAMYNEVVARGMRNGRVRDILREIRATSPYAVPGFAADAAAVIAPHRALADLQASAGAARFVTDIGGHMLFALHYLTARGPDDFFIALSLGSMGSGIAGAIGLALGDRSRPVVCVCGDGGMQMAGMELLTAAKLGLPIVYAVFNDARYNIVYHGMRQLFGCDARWDTPRVDFAAWARSMGVAGVTVERPGEITPALMSRLYASRTPAVLDIHIDPEVQLQSGRIEALQHMSMLAQ